LPALLNVAESDRREPIDSADLHEEKSNWRHACLYLVRSSRTCGELRYRKHHQNTKTKSSKADFAKPKVCSISVFIQTALKDSSGDPLDREDEGEDVECCTKYGIHTCQRCHRLKHFDRK
jgi:hypothetical protein